MSKQTPLYQAHVDHNAKLVDFAGYSLPIHYGSQIVEHKAVRDSAGMFDVSHMTIVDLQDIILNDINQYWYMIPIGLRSRHDGRFDVLTIHKSNISKSSFTFKIYDFIVFYEPHAIIT